MRELLLAALIATGAGALLYFHAWRAYLWLFPQSARHEPDTPADQLRIPHELLAQVRELERLGFTPLGSRSAQPKFGPQTLFYDFAHAQAGVFATVFLGKDGRALLYFLTPGADGAFVITANYHRAARAVPGRYLSGGLEDFPAERVYKAHLKRIESFRSSGPFDAQGRFAAEQAWLAGPGRSEVRREHLSGLTWCIGAVGMLAAFWFGQR